MLATWVESNCSDPIFMADLTQDGEPTVGMDGLVQLTRVLSFSPVLQSQIMMV